MANDPVTVNGNHHQVNGEKSYMTVKSPLAEQSLDVKKGSNSTVDRNREGYSNNHATRRKCRSFSSYLGRWLIITFE